ncbi:MAG: aldose 1-epimerase family protein [Spirochaetota bacterium]
MMNTITAEGIEITVNSLGAELFSIKDAFGRERLWQGDPAYWPNRSPILFPIIGRLPGGRYTFEGKSYEPGLHGFARHREFSLAAQSPSSLTYELGSDDATLELYPFHFRVRVEYRLSRRGLEVGFRVTNEDERELRFSIGGHPAFRVPLLPGEAREDYDIVFEKRETISRQMADEAGQRTGEEPPFLVDTDTVPIVPELFEWRAILLSGLRSRSVSLRSRVSKAFVTLRFGDFPVLGLWSAPGQAPFVCIEPWQGTVPLAGADPDLSTKEGCLDLSPGATFEVSYGIEVG